MPAVHRALLLVAATSVTLACSPDKGFGASRAVDAEDYGAAWPLTVETAVLNCSPEGLLLIQVDGRSFDLEASGIGDAHPAFRRVWAEDPKRSNQRRDLGALVEDARELCE